ncbi:hypothetical protein [Flavobacterium sp.]|uniref:hypothetical protein n=1 Tax=Flavobacterium sp. TaxID=239 RepID=UPI0037528B5F
MGLIKNSILVIITVLLFTSCKNEKKDFYKTGKIKSVCELNSDNQKNGAEKIFYETGELMFLQHFKNGKQIDSSLSYYKDGSIQSIIKMKNDSLFCKTFNKKILTSEGVIDSLSRAIGWWNYYTNNKISSKQENIIIKGKSVINRQKAYFENKFIFEKSKFYNLIRPNRIESNNEVLLKFVFNFYEPKKEKNLFGKEYYYLLVSPEINNDFSNLDGLKLDTIVNKKDQFDFYIKFKKPGIKNIKGIIEKHILIKENNKILIKKSRIYVNEEVNVN